MTFTDDDLTQLETDGLPSLPDARRSGHVEHDGARIWYADFGEGPPVVLLHGGLGNAGNWAYQIPALVAAGYRVVGIDSRGQGRSNRDQRPFSYKQMAADARAVLDRLGIERAAFVGWSDGAVISLEVARAAPERVAGVFFFACNVDGTGALPFQPTPRIDRIYAYHVSQYAALSPTPDRFEQMRDDLTVMQGSQPDYSVTDLGAIAVPVWSVIGGQDEFIRREHAEYIARSVADGRFLLLEAVSHFAPVQRPDMFNAVLLSFLDAVLPHHGD